MLPVLREIAQKRLKPEMLDLNPNPYGVARFGQGGSAQPQPSFTPTTERSRNHRHPQNRRMPKKGSCDCQALPLADVLGFIRLKGVGL